MTSHMSKWATLLVAAILLSAANLSAQFDTGRIVGTVTDAAGAVVPGATVRVTNLGTGRVHETQTNQVGNFAVPSLPAGNYKVEVVAQGFRTAVVSNIVVHATETVRTDVQLLVGPVAEQVDVTASRMTVDTETSSLGAVIDEQRIRDLPLNGRRFEDLIALTPGAVTTGAPGQRSLGGFETMFAGINILLDGADATRIDVNATSTQFGRQRSGISRTSVESLEEFRVLQGTYSAEYGRSYGDVVNAITRSGTNDLHGSVYEFFRNDQLNSRNFFDGDDPAPLRFNQFGASLGGPIARDKLFFFFNYEGVRKREALSQETFVVSQAERGNFVASMQPVLDAIPLGNAGSTADPRFDNFRGELKKDVREDTFMTKLDWTISSQDSLSGRYTFNDSDTDDQFGFAEGQIAPTPGRNQLFKLTWKHIFNATTLNEAGFAINRVKTNSFGGGEGFPIIGAFEPLGVVPGPSLFSVRSPQVSFQLLDTFSKVVGRHNIRAGLDIRRNRTNRELETQDILTYGSFADFQNNAGFALTRLGFPMVGFRNTNYNFFIQDDFRVTPRLTLNLGLRYEYNSVINEENDQVSNFDFDAQQILPPGESFYDDDRNNFAPRVGFAWDPWGLGKTVVRGGFGIYYNPLLTGAVLSLPSNNFPNFTVTIFDVLFGLCPGFPLSFPIPETLPSCVTPVGPPQNVNGIDPEMRDSYAERWSLNIQQEVVRETILEIAYVGLHGLKLPAGASCAGRNVNRVDLTTGMRPNPGFGDERFLGNYLKSNYNALQASLRRRTAGMLNFDINYTYGHELDNCINILAGDFQDPFNIGNDYADGDVDVRHVFTASYLFDVPVWEAAGQFGSGWQLAGIFQARSGFPVNIFENVPVFVADPLRPDPVAGQSCRPADYSTPDSQLNPNAFTSPANPEAGLLERNACRGPNFWQLDFSVIKDTTLTETVTLQFRAEIFNIFNRPNFTNPDSVRTSPAFGESQSVVGQTTVETSTGPGFGRQIQFALKLIF